jgi:hypothetical protein
MSLFVIYIPATILAAIFETPRRKKIKTYRKRNVHCFA